MGIRVRATLTLTLPLPLTLTKAAELESRLVPLRSLDQV